ncbi:hypothetical protein V2H77_08785 [Photorhabdus sp. P32]|uniref:hypothetical protein n=1 Tax=Photorhabdus sp. P32 TaxID=3117549 RepID=UPI00311ABB8E
MLEKIIDRIEYTFITMVKNNLLNNVKVSIGNTAQPPGVVPDNSARAAGALIRLAGPGTDPKNILKFVIVTDLPENNQKIWVFQDSRREGNVIMYHVGEDFIYREAKEVRGNSVGGINKYLIINEEDSDIVLTMY